jgi:hypothetical protein
VPLKSSVSTRSRRDHAIRAARTSGAGGADESKVVDLRSVNEALPASAYVKCYSCCCPKSVEFVVIDARRSVRSTVQLIKKLRILPEAAATPHYSQ